METLRHAIAHGISSFVIVLKNFVYLILAPYKTMRKISLTHDYGQVALIFGIAAGYFVYAQIIRQRTFHPFVVSYSALLAIAMFFVTFFLVTRFFYEYFRKSSNVTYDSILHTFSYSLLPTFIWFFTTSTLFYFLPPPRSTTFLGKGFSITFVVFSITLLLWRFALLYLSLRFSTKQHFYRIILGMGMFTAWFIPYSYLMYRLQIFRIPFI